MTASDSSFLGGLLDSGFIATLEVISFPCSAPYSQIGGLRFLRGCDFTYGWFALLRGGGGMSSLGQLNLLKCIVMDLSGKNPVKCSEKKLKCSGRK